MLNFKTESGSLYQVDEKEKKIRRLNGVNDPTSRQGKDGEWKNYESLFLEVGKSAVICWDPATTPLMLGSGGIIPATITSTVVSIEEVN